MTPESQIGKVTWVDLTVDNADEIRDFYQAVVGWEHEEVSMGDYSDYALRPPSSNDPVCGVCHARGSNAGAPAQWLIYVTVVNLEESLTACEKLGGKILMPPRNLGEGRMCVIEDPAGAVLALCSS